jgi:hypothetical protein
VVVVEAEFLKLVDTNRGRRGVVFFDRRVFPFQRLETVVQRVMQYRIK